MKINYKPLIFLVGIGFFLAMTLIILSIDIPKKKNELTIKETSINNTITDKTSIPPKSTPKIIETPVNTSTVNFTKANERKNINKHDNKGLLEIVKNFRENFVIAVNTNNKDKFKYIVTSTSPIYKESVKKVDTFVKNKINLELKKIDLVNVKTKNNTITLITKENIGTKKADGQFVYKDYNVTYIIKKNTNGYLIESQKGGI